ncbi:MAG: glycosyltransferase [Verrucomicrobiota bacterium]
MTDPLVSIILRSYNEGWALRDTLRAIRHQDYSDWELLVFDSGSTDDSVAQIRAFQPRAFVQLPADQYVPGRVMNNGMRLARSNYCVFLNADATPANESWLRPLVRALQEPNAAAVFGRQMPRPNCQAVFACDYSRCFGPNRESAGWQHFFSMVSSGVSREIWHRRGFSETLQYAEDDEYTRWCRKEGYGVVYCPESTVIHSHNYSPAQAYRRSFGDAQALAACWEGSPAQFNWMKTVLLGWFSDLRHDFFYCARHGRLRELPHALQIRWSQRRGRLAGFQNGWQTYRGA